MTDGFIGVDQNGEIQNAAYFHNRFQLRQRRMFDPGLVKGQFPDSGQSAILQATSGFFSRLVTEGVKATQTDKTVRIAADGLTDVIIMLLEKCRILPGEPKNDGFIHSVGVH